MNPPPVLPVPVEGVFAYLDVALQEIVKEALAAADTGTPPGDYLFSDSVQLQVQDYIKDQFRLMHRASPLRQALDAFLLYHRDDMAHALTQAYRLHLRGENPVEALKADYSLDDWGLLQWNSRQEVMDAHKDRWLWNQMAPFYKEGDRFIRYSQPAETGTLLVRGDRLVWQVPQLHMNISAMPPHWMEAHDKFLELGGTKAFLAGEFIWPLESWMNPVVNEREVLIAAEPVMETVDQMNAAQNIQSSDENATPVTKVFASSTLTDEMLIGETPRCFTDAMLPEPDTEQNFHSYVAWLAEHLYYSEIPVPPRHAWVLAKLDKAVSPEAFISSLGMGAGNFDEGSTSICSAIQRGLSYRDYIAEKLADWQEWDGADPATLHTYTVNPDLYARLEAEEADRLNLGVTSENADIPYRPFLAHALKKLPDHAARVSAIRGFFAEYNDAASK